jgi:hypothetical protein
LAKILKDANMSDTAFEFYTKSLNKYGKAAKSVAKDSLAIATNV